MTEPQPWDLRNCARTERGGQGVGACNYSPFADPSLRLVIGYTRGGVLLIGNLPPGVFHRPGIFPEC